MAEKSVRGKTSPSLEEGSGQYALHDLPNESNYHDEDVFGREEDHDVCILPVG